MSAGGGGTRLSEALRVLASAGQELDADQVLDVLWLARRLPGGVEAPLGRPAGVEPQVPQPPAADEPDKAAPTRPATGPDPDDPDLPDLTAPSLYAAARQPSPTIPEIRLRQDPGPSKALPVRVPEDKALTGELELGRALRPLRRRQASPHRLEIDEERTAAELAETLLPDVVLRPVQERWLHLALLVDDGLSMLLWHRLGAELRTLLERLGAFATTRVLGLDARSPGEPRLHARPFRPDSTPVPLSAVSDPSGRTLVLVVSDGMGASWRSGALHALLSAWASRGPAALLHTLPPDLWEGSGIQAERWQATTRRIGGANTSWEITDPVLPPDLARFDGVPVPVLEPTAASLRNWSHLLASPGATVQLPLLARPRRYGDMATAPLDPGDAQHFRDAATPEAYRLAAHLAAVSPLTVPVMRLVQTAVPWRARTSHLAEVFLGGLMRPHPAPVPGPLPAKHQVFDFSDASRSVLLDAVPQSELLRTSRSIGRRLEQLAGNSPDFPAWLAHPDGSAQLPGSHRPFTSVERRLLTRFGVSFDPGVHGLERGPGQSAASPDGWQPLTDDDPRRLGQYRLLARRRLRRTVEYNSIDRQGTPAMVHIARSDLLFDTSELIALEAEALRRLDGHYAPAMLVEATDADSRRHWLATTPVHDGSGRPPRLAELFNQAHRTGTAPFDKLTALLVGWHLASALALCHLHEIVPVDLSAENIFVLRRTVLLADLSDCAVAGRYAGTGPAPVPEDNVRALGELLQLVSSKAGWELPGQPEGMHLWQGDTWAPLRRVVLRCLDPDPAERPTAGEVADVLANYIAHEHVPARQPNPTLQQAVRAPLALPPAAVWPTAEPPIRPPRFAAARREREARLARLRRPLRHARRVTLVGAYHYSGRATTTMALGSLLAAVRGEPVLALDGAADEGALGAFLTRRNPATVRDLADLPAEASYEEVRARTTALPSGLEVAAYPPGHVPPNLAHAQAYAHALARTAPYYSFVLTDWAPLRLDRSADTVLDLTDRLILCCGSAGWFLDAAWRVLDRLRGSGRRRLADEAVVVMTQVEGLSARPIPDNLHTRFDIGADQVVTVPFDKSLHSPGFRELNQLRTPTLNAFLDLAELVVRH
ncbi:SAV_2336 N-terminal domain-related protein [Streptomyces sp. NPDC056628]|uniref:SAV_2336 N-terminal domain-related protein n=1 Tax=Streptomyces sp. NPDC056628 TaxID=3345882 RepID=UPI0036B5AED6